jgi:hypothetical protein
VCRGQTALSVIRDNFWVFFDSDKLTEHYPETALELLNQQQGKLSMPVVAGSNAGGSSTWNKYSKLEQAYLKAKSDIMTDLVKDGGKVTLDLV